MYMRAMNRMELMKNLSLNVAGMVYHIFLVPKQVFVILHLIFDIKTIMDEVQRFSSGWF